MKKLFLTLIVATFLFGCSNEKKEGWEFNKENSMKNEGFTFDKTDYSNNKNNSSTISNEHSGCQKSCCSKK